LLQFLGVTLIGRYSISCDINILFTAFELNSLLDHFKFSLPFLFFFGLDHFVFLKFFIVVNVRGDIEFALVTETTDFLGMSAGEFFHVWGFVVLDEVGGVETGEVVVEFVAFAEDF
jgi:hypothetical protein